MPNLLVTAFGPFPTVPRNPSAALARRVTSAPRLRLRGVAARCVVLTTSYATLAAELGPALAEVPDAVLMLGVAARSRMVRVESRATGRRSTLFPDAAGETAARSSAASSRGARRTRASSTGALLCLRRRGLPARISRDAGRYLCNAAYHRALGESAPVLFVHIPLPPRRGRAAWDAVLAAALVEIALGLVAQGRVAARAGLG